jgi:hypothetical protein
MDKEIRDQAAMDQVERDQAGMGQVKEDQAVRDYGQGPGIYLSRIRQSEIS